MLSLVKFPQPKSLFISLLFCRFFLPTFFDKLPLQTHDMKKLICHNKVLDEGEIGVNARSVSTGSKKEEIAEQSLPHAMFLLPVSGGEERGGGRDKAEEEIDRL